MTPAEVSKVLTKCAAYDQRTIGQADVLAWHEVLADVVLADALDAVRRHYRDEYRRAMPADIRRLSRDAKSERRQRERETESGPLPPMLPSRYEPHAGDYAKPTLERTAQVRNAARARIAQAQRKAAEARRRFASAQDALDALEAALAKQAPPQEESDA